MKNRTLAANLKYIILSVGACLAIVLSWTVIVSLSVRSQLGALPSDLETSKLFDYEELFGSLDRIQRLDPRCAQYYTKRADLASKAMQNGLAKQLNITLQEIEKLYFKAIALNPLNFETPLKLAWFYDSFNYKDARPELEKVLRLYPKDYQGYLYLGLYNIKKKDPLKAFTNIVLSFHLAGSYGPYQERIKTETTRLLRDYPVLSIDQNNALVCTVASNGKKIELKQYGMPHINTSSVTIRLTVNNALETIILTDATGLRKVVKRDLASPLLYEINPTDLFPRSHLDEITISVLPPDALEQIQFIKRW